MGEGGTSWTFHTHAACFQLLPTLEGASGFVWYSTEPQPREGQQLPAPIHLTQAHAPPPLSHMHTPQPTPCPSGDCVEPGVFWGGAQLPSHNSAVLHFWPTSSNPANFPLVTKHFTSAHFCLAEQYGSWIWPRREPSGRRASPHPPP